MYSGVRYQSSSYNVITYGQPRQDLFDMQNVNSITAHLVRQTLQLHCNRTKF